MKRKLTFFILTALCVLSLWGIETVTKHEDVADSAPVEIYQGKYDDYTDSNDVYLTATSSHVFEIEDYKAMIYPLFTTVYTQDNPIVQIVPRELFTHRGEYFYVGAEYGFYVDTRANTEAGNISTVFVFDIKYDLNLNDADVMSITIEPLFCYDFYYLTSQNNFTFQQELYRNGEFIGYYTEDDMTYTIPATGVNDIVVAAQFCDSRVSSLIKYQENCNYFLKDIAVRANIFNEYHPNIGDDAYRAYADDGSFFTAAKTEFVAINAQVSGNQPIEFTGTALSMRTDFFDIRAEAWDYVSKGLSFFEYSMAIHNTPDYDEMGGPNAASHRKYELAETELFNSKQSQLDNYGRLIKQAYAGIISVNMPVLFGTNGNHYLKANFNVTYDGNGDPWQTRLASGMALQMVKLGYNGTVREVATYEGTNTTNKSLRSTREYLSLYRGEENVFYQLPGGTAKFIYSPMSDSHYILTPYIDEEYDIKVICDRASIPIVYENGGYTVPMESGKTYYIIIDTADKSDIINGTVLLDYKTFDGDFALYMDSGQEMYIKYLTDDKGAYHMTATDGVIFGRTYGGGGNIVDFDGEAAHKDFITSGQETRYMIIRNDGTSGVKQFSCQHAPEWQPTVEVNHGAKIYRFTAEKTGKYIFYSTGGATLLRFMIFNLNGVEIGGQEVIFNDGVALVGHVVWAEAGETVYILIRTDSPQTQILHFNVDVS